MALNLRPKNKAFSLLEVIIAITVLSIGVVFVLRALSYSVRLTGLSFDIIRAVLLTQDKMQELEFKEKQNLLYKEPAEFKDKRDKFERKYTLVLNRDLNLYRLDFDVTWQRANRDEKLILNTYLKQ